ncbi:MAG: hypothetical protein ACYC9K_00905 [Sulfuricaulis sp.]
MATRPLTDFYDYTLPDLPGCPQPLALQKITEAMIEFFRVSKAYKYQHPPINVVAGVSYYPFVPPAGYVVEEIIQRQIFYNGIKLTTETMDEVSRRFADWNTITGQPVYYLQTDTLGFTLVPMPLVSVVAVPPAAAPALGSTPGGALAQTTYYARITYTTDSALTVSTETTASPESSLLVAVDNLLTIASPPLVNGATGYNVYLGNTASGGSGSETLQNAAPIAIGTSWTLPSTGLVTGVGLPVGSLSGLTLKVILQPTLAATTIDSAIFEKYQEKISHGVKAKLMSMSGKPWSKDKDLLKYHLDEWSGALATAAIQATKGYTGARIRTIAHFI